MTTTQKIIKYCAIAFAVFLIFSIISGIAGAIGLIGNFVISNEVSENLDELNLGTDAKVLEVELKATNLTIKNGTELTAETNNEYITIKNENNRLIIKEKKHNLFKNSNAKELIVYVPEDMIFDGVTITSGAGNIEIENIDSKKMFLDLGAGNVSVSNLIIGEEIEINGGAGNLTIHDGSMHNLSLDLGVGDVTVSSLLTGEIDVDTGVGRTTINVLDIKDNYQIEVDKGIGDINIDGVSVKDEYSYGNSFNQIDIDGGIGNIIVNFRN